MLCVSEIKTPLLKKEHLTIIKLSTISVAYNCFPDVLQGELIILKLSSEVNKIKLIRHLPLTACRRTSESQGMRKETLQDKSHNAAFVFSGLSIQDRPFVVSLFKSVFVKTSGWSRRRHSANYRPCWARLWAVLLHKTLRWQKKRIWSDTADGMFSDGWLLSRNSHEIA